MYILPFCDTLHAAYVYRDWLPEDDRVVRPKHMGAFITIAQ
jgi:hypothetical protein